MATKMCTSCGTRPAMTAAQKRAISAPSDGQICELCLREAEWENIHSDYGHETLEIGEDAAGYMKIDCWICTPELNQASADYVARAGSSRAGMVLTVPIRAAGREKAASLVERFERAGMATSISSRKGVVTMKVAASAGTGAVLRWDTEGHFLTCRVTRDDHERGARNVAEALRLLAI